VQSVTKAFDGDTFALSDGSRVRLAGLDTPELGHGARADAPFARDAARLLTRVLAETGNEVRLEPAQEAHDHYGRMIAHAYSRTGRSIQEQILRAGLALGYARPPNLEHTECYRAAEAEARRQRLGLWDSPAQRVDTLSADMTGFVRLQGTVGQINRTRASVWINLGQRLSLRVAQEDFTHFSTFDLSRLSGRTLEVRGYLYRDRGDFQMRIRHPADLRIIDGS
jgi:micrococcal nuclease